MYCHLISYRSGKAVTDKTITEACAVLRDMDMLDKDWKQSMQAVFVDSMRQQVITKRQYVDVVPQGQKAGGGQTSQATTNDTVIGLATELQRVKSELKSLQAKHWTIMAMPKQHLEVLRDSVLEHLDDAGVDKVHVRTPGENTPEVFVGACIKYKSKKISMRTLKAIICDTLQQCDDTVTVETITSRATEAITQYRINEQEKSEVGRVRCTKAPCRQKWA